MAYRSHVAPLLGRKSGLAEGQGGVLGAACLIEGQSSFDHLTPLLRALGDQLWTPTSPKGGSVESGSFNMGSPTSNQGISGPDWDFWAPGS